MKPDCQMCGSCCRGFLIVEADYLDVLREPLILEVHQNPTQPTLAELEMEEKCVVLACGLERPCHFLHPASSGCAIYPTRPGGCVYMQAGSTQCTNSRKLHGLKPVRAHRRIANPEPEAAPVDVEGQMTFDEVLS